MESICCNLFSRDCLSEYLRIRVVTYVCLDLRTGTSFWYAYVCYHKIQVKAD